MQAIAQSLNGIKTKREAVVFAILKKLTSNISSQSAYLLNNFGKILITGPLFYPYTAKLEAMNMLFGIVPYAIGNHAINHCLMYCRYFIHLEVRNNNCPKFHKFIEYYKQKLNIEKETYIVRNEFALFSKLFGKLINIIQITCKYKM